jgi:hypothetical protein
MIFKRVKFLKWTKNIKKTCFDQLSTNGFPIHPEEFASMRAAETFAKTGLEGSPCVSAIALASAEVAVYCASKGLLNIISQFNHE